MIATLFKRSLQLLAAIILIAAFFLVWVANTEAGLNFALRQAAPLMTVAKASGQLSDAHFKDVQINLDGVQIGIAELDFVWSPLNLVSKTLQVEKILATNVEVNLKQTENQNSEPWSGVELPIDFVLQDFRIQLLSVSPAEGESVFVNQVRGGLSAKASQLTLDSIRAASEKGSLIIDGSLGLKAEPNDVIKLQVNAQTDLEEQDVAVDVEASLDGMWQEIQLTSNLKARPLRPEGSRQENTGQDAEEKITEFALNGLISAVLSPEPNLKITGSWSVPFSLGLTDSAPIQMEYTNLINKGDFEFSGLPNDFNFDAQGITYSGSDSLVQLIANGVGSSEGVSLNQLRVETGLEDESPFTNFEGTANLDWSSDLKWLLDGQLIDLEPRLLLGDQFSDLGKLSGQLSTQGQFSAQANNPLGAIGDLTASRLTATWQGRPIRADLKLGLLEDSIRLDDLAIKSASFDLLASGVLGDESDLTWSLNAAKLNHISKQLGGSLKAKGRVGGPIASPSVKFDLDAAKIRVMPLGVDSKEFWKLASLNASAEISQLRGNAPLDLKIKAAKLEQGAQMAAETLVVELSGTVQKHLLKLSSRLPGQANFSAALNGHFAGNNKALADADWSGEVVEFALDSEKVSEWQLSKPSQLNINAGQVDLARTCIAAKEQSLCAEASFSSKTARQFASLDLVKFDLAAFEPFLELQDIKLQGSVDGQLKFTSNDANALPKIDAQLNGRSVRIGLPESLDEEELDNPARASLTKGSVDRSTQSEPSGDTRREWLDFEVASLSLMQSNSSQAKLNLRLDQDNYVEGALSSEQPVLVSDFKEVPLDGVLKLKWIDLSMLPTQLIGGTQINGQLESEFELNGSLSNPEVSVRSELSKANLFLPATGVTYSNISAVVVSQSQSKIDFNGSLDAGEGALSFEGEMDFSSLDSPLARLTLKGEKLTLLQTSDIEAVGSLDLIISLQDQITELSGDVVIEKADLQLGASENVVLASNDVVVLGSESNGDQNRQRLRLNIDLGDATNLSAAGLSAELKGKMGISQEPGKLMVGQGQIEVINGVYQAYGEELTISKGQLVFNGSSVENPRLDLEATRDVEDVVAGVRVQGTAQAPQLSLFSNPAMSDQDVLSTLVFGKKISSLGGEDSLTLLKIAASLRGNGPDRFSRMTGQLQDALGLSELELRMAQDSPEIVAGKQLTSRFYVGYGYGLLDAAQSLVLRFNINDAWSIQGDFGANNGADLRYQIER